MSKNRYINTKFWSDGFIVELNPLDRYLFLYFLTNEHTNICGIYELPLRTMAFETGIEKEMLSKMIDRLSGKVYYLNGWVYIKNFSKHQAINESVKKGIAANLENIPLEILEEIKKIDTLRHPATPCTHPATYFNSNFNSNFNNSEPSSPMSKKELLEKMGIKAKGKNIQLWQDEAANAVKILKAEKVSSVFKCFKENNQKARIALSDCKELGKMNELYFLKVYNELVKNNK